MPLPSSLRKASQLLEEFHHFTRRNKIIAVSKNWGPTPLVLFCLLTYLTPAVSKDTNRNICRICRLAPLANRSFSCLTRTRRLHQSQSTSQIMPLGSCWFRQACTACKKPLPCTCHNVQAANGFQSITCCQEVDDLCQDSQDHKLRFEKERTQFVSLAVNHACCEKCHLATRTCLWASVSVKHAEEGYAIPWENHVGIRWHIWICPSYPILSDPIQSIHLSSATINLSLYVVTHQNPEIGKIPLQNLPLNNRKL